MTDDIYIADSVVFQSHSLGDFWIVYFPILWGSGVSGEDWCFVLLFKALNALQSLADSVEETDERQKLIP